MEDSFNDEKLVIAVKELKDMLINKTTMNKPSERITHSKRI